MDQESIQTSLKVFILIAFSMCYFCDAKFKKNC